jgi:hypothetical protein
MSGIWGNIIDSADVEKALLAHLKAWHDTSLAAALRDKDPEEEIWPDHADVEPIQTYDVKHMVAEKWPEDALPMYLASSPGMAEDPVQDEEGLISAVYGVLLIAIAEGGGPDPETDAKDLSRLYANAAILSIMQEPSLKAGGDVMFAEGITLGQVTNYAITKGVEGERNISAVSIPLLIGVPDILDTTGGPIEPLEDPNEEPDPWPEVKPGGGSVEVRHVD